jgi:hypothetical protein
MFLLTHTFKDPKLAQRQTEELRAWLESLANRKVQMPATAQVSMLEEELVD